VADKQITRSFIFDGERMRTHCVAAMILPRSLAAHTVIMHGCEPVSDPLEITRIEGPVVYELNKRPAMDVIRQTITDVEIGSRPALTVTLGEKRGHPEDAYDESRYINRLILGSNPVDGSVTLFEADFKKGTRIQIMQRSNRRMIESVRRRTKELLDSLEGQTLLGALYIDCGGRAGFFCHSDTEEGDVLRESLGARVPLLGFYSGVEIAPLLGRSRPLDWTGVLTIFTDARK
jgi:small ligand-binding sensory domain FIST